MTPEQRREQRKAHLAIWRAQRVTLGKGKPKEHVPCGTRTRFSREANGTKAHYSKDLIRLEVVRRYKAGQGYTEIARALGLPNLTVGNWTTQSTLPVKPTSPYTFARMLALVTLARQLYRQKFDPDPKRCLWEAIRRTPSMKRSSVKVYLSLEAVPSLPGFPLYADQATQARCEALGRGERSRGTDIFDDPVMPQPVRAPEPSAPVPVPLARTPALDRERFLAARYRLQLPKLQL